MSGAELQHNHEMALEATTTVLSGQAILDYPLYNKGSAFPEEERLQLGLLGLLPFHCSTMDEQLTRTYGNYLRKESDLERYVFLTALQDRNEALFYRLVSEHITEMMPIIYTPTVGVGCQKYSHMFRRPRGLYVSYPYRNEIATLLENSPVKNVKVIVVTDGERILGLGDLGVGGMGIPVGKLSLYSLCAGIHPATTLPILLDVGTDNKELLADPLYLGWRHERIRGAAYGTFVEAFVTAVMNKFPGVLLQWEDFSKQNAPRLLERYRNRLCTFNDDIQGTGAVTLAGLLVAMRLKQEKLRNQRIIILGAGSSASGISAQIVTAMKSEGASEEEAKRAIWLVDSQGLVHSGRADLEPFKEKFAQPLARTMGWQRSSAAEFTFAEVVNNVQPTILLGTSAQPGAFTEQIIREMSQHTERPIVFPLSNPTSKCEATPRDLLTWTDGRALVATGSPFSPVVHSGRSISIGQCNNSFIFPGVGLGVIATGAKRVTDEMFVAAARVLAEFSPALTNETAPLYPSLEVVREVSSKVALAVAKEAQLAGFSQRTTAAELDRRIKSKMWTPHYVSLIARD